MLPTHTYTGASAKGGIGQFEDGRFKLDRTQFVASSDSDE